MSGEPALSTTKRLTIGVCAAIAVIGLARYAWPTIGPSSWGPRVSIPQPTIDVGRLKIGTPVSQEFIIHNTGRQPLKLSTWRSEDIKVEYGHKQIPPKSAGSVTLHLSGLSSAGRFSRWAFLETNAPGQPYLRLAVCGENSAAIEIDRHQVGLGTISSGDQSEAVVTLRAMAGTEFEILSVKCDTETFSSRVEELEAKKEYRVLLACNPDIPLGLNWARFEIETDHAVQSKIPIEVFAYVK